MQHLELVQHFIKGIQLRELWVGAAIDNQIEQNQKQLIYQHLSTTVGAVPWYFPPKKQIDIVVLQWLDLSLAVI